MSRRSHQPRRGGAILVVVLICLAIATAVALVVVRQIATERLAAQTEHRRVQAVWLAEAAIERAAARLAADPQYSGETWNLAAKDFAAGGSGTVKIQVAAVADRPRQHAVRVEACYATSAEYRCQYAKQIVVESEAVPSHQPTKAHQPTQAP